MLIDTHTHIDFFENPKEFVEQSIEANVKRFIVPGVEPTAFEEIVALSNEFEEIYFALGVHPSEINTFNSDVANKIIEYASNKKMVAIGEIGLDYYWDKENKEEQKKVFKLQLEIAKTLDLPVLIHDRDAHKDCFDILKEYEMKRVCMHCFSGSKEFARECVNMGYFIALGGVVTFKNAIKMKEVAKEIPLEKLLLETDSPYLAPHPMRGEKNSSKYLPFVAKEIANLKDISFEEVEFQTTKNCENFFKF